RRRPPTTARSWHRRTASPGATQLEVIVTGPDQEALAPVADEVAQLMHDVGATDVTNNLTDTVPALEVEVDREAAARAGLTEVQVGTAVATAMRGDTVGQIMLGTTPTQVVVHRSEGPAGRAPLEALVVGAGPDGPVTVAEVASLERVDHLVRCTRTG